MRIRRFVPLALLGLLLAGPARGQVELLVLEPRSPFLSAAETDQLESALRAQAEGYPDLELQPPIGWQALAGQAGCQGTAAACLAAMGRARDADRVLFSQLQKLPGRRLLELRLIDAANGRQLAKARLRVRRGQPGLRRALRQGWIRLFGRRVACRLRVEANAADVPILLDGQPLGRTPLRVVRRLRPGKHTLSARHPDYKVARRRLRVRPGRCGRRIRFQLELRPEAADIPPVALVASADEPGASADEPGSGAPKGSGASGIAEDKGPGSGGLKTGTERPELEEPGAADEPVASADEPGASADEPGASADEPGSGAPKAGDDSIAGPLLRRRPAAEPERPEPYVPKAAAEPEPADGATPVYQRWWFWTAIGAAVAAGVVTGTVLGLDDGGGGIPSGQGRVSVQF
jgi:hypothetical protein